MQEYKLVILETPFVNNLSELEEQVTRLVNKAIEVENEAYYLDSVEIYEKVGDGIYHIACHFQLRKISQA